MTNTNINKKNFYDEIKHAALKNKKEEVCGLVIKNCLEEIVVLECENIFEKKQEGFIISPEIFLNISKISSSLDLTTFKTKFLLIFLKFVLMK